MAALPQNVSDFFELWDRLLEPRLDSIDKQLGELKSTQGEMRGEVRELRDRLVVVESSSEVFLPAKAAPEPKGKWGTFAAMLRENRTAVWGFLGFLFYAVVVDGKGLAVVDFVSGILGR